MKDPNKLIDLSSTQNNQQFEIPSNYDQSKCYISLR